MKNNKRKCTARILIIVFLSTVIVAMCVVNIWLAVCSDGNSANVFTAISGWVGFLATVGVGVITVLQNIRFERRTYMQNELDKLRSTRALIYSNSKQFINNNAIFDERTIAFMISGDSNALYLEMSVLRNLNNLCHGQIYDIYNTRFCFKGLKELLTNLCDFNKLINKVHSRMQINVNYKKCCDLYKAVQSNYFDLITEIDNIIEYFANDKISYKDFKMYLEKLKDISALSKELYSVVQNYNENK